VCVSICVSNVSENCRKVESCSVGEMFFHNMLVVMLGVGGGGDGTVVTGAMRGVRVGGRVSDCWERRAMCRRVDVLEVWGVNPGGDVPVVSVLCLI
jgi:hypothetical protein